MDEFLTEVFRWLIKQPLGAVIAVGSVIVAVAAGLIYLWRRPNLLRAKADKQRAEDAKSKIDHSDAATLKDWIVEVDERVAALESEPAEVTALLKYGTAVGAPLELVIMNKSTRLHVESLDARVRARDGQECAPVRVTQLGSLDLQPGEFVHVSWPGEAGAGHSFIVRLNWREGDRLHDNDVVVWDPAA